MEERAMFGKIGESRNSALLAGTEGRKIGIAVKPGSEALMRGTVLQKENDTGLYIAPATGTLANGKCVILNEDVDTGSASTGLAGTALAYESGRFQHTKIKLKSGTLSAADYLELQRQGIYTDGEGESFTNNVG